MSKTKVLKSNTTDLTTGVIWKKLLLYFLPIAAGTLFQQLYNAVDAIVVGRFVGTEALAAVGGTPATLTQLIIGFFVALSGGAAVVIAQYCGAKEEARVSAAVSTSMIFCFIIGVLLAVAMFFIAPALLEIFNTPEDTMAGATLYTRVFFSGSAFLLLFNMGSGILRSVGDSKRPFIYLMISCLLNIILDLLFVIVFKMGVAGVAWATVIAQGISCVLIIIKLITVKDYYRLPIRKMKFNFQILGKMMAIGIPSGVQSAMYGISNLILQAAVNTLGTVVVASWAMSGKLDGVYWALASAFGVAVTTFVAQNYGAGKKDRIRECAKIGMLIYGAGTIVMSGLLLLLARPLLHIFTTDTAVMDSTWIVLIYIVPAYVIWSVIEMFSGVLRGMGDASRPTVIVALGVCVLRIVWTYTMFRFVHTLPILCLSYPLSWFVTAILLLIYYKFRRKKLYQL